MSLWKLSIKQICQALSRIIKPPAPNGKPGLGIFPVVFVPGVRYLPNRHSDPQEEARLLYVAMTRAINQLVLTCDRDSSFVSKI